MEYEVEIHDVWIPISREQAERMFEGWEFTDHTGSRIVHGLDRLNGLAPGEECKLVSGHVRFRRVA